MLQEEMNSIAYDATTAVNIGLKQGAIRGETEAAWATAASGALRQINFTREYKLQNIPLVQVGKAVSDYSDGNPLDLATHSIRAVSEKTGEHMRQVVSTGRPGALVETPIKKDGRYDMVKAVQYYPGEHMPDPGGETSAATEIERNARLGAEAERRGR